MLPLKEKLTILQGRTFRRPVRWATEEFVYVPVSSISKAAPCRVVTASPHGIPDGWPVAIVSALGMVQANAEVDSETGLPVEGSYRPARLINATEVDFNTLNSAGFSTYTSGGYLQYRKPKDLAGYSARMSIKTAYGGTVLVTLTTENGGVLIDATACTVTLFISATDTAALTWKVGVYDLELISPTGVVTALLSGAVVVVPEVTT